MKNKNIKVARNLSECPFDENIELEIGVSIPISVILTPSGVIDEGHTSYKFAYKLFYLQTRTRDISSFRFCHLGC